MGVASSEALGRRSLKEVTPLSRLRRKRAEEFFLQPGALGGAAPEAWGAGGPITGESLAP